MPASLALFVKSFWLSMTFSSTSMRAISAVLVPGEMRIVASPSFFEPPQADNARQRVTATTSDAAAATSFKRLGATGYIWGCLRGDFITVRLNNLECYGTRREGVVSRLVLFRAGAVAKLAVFQIILMQAAGGETMGIA